MHVLGCLFSIIFIVFFVAFALLGSLWLRIRSFFGMSPFDKPGATSNTRDERRQQPFNTSHTTPRETTKVFADDEGEYVEFEEVKE